MPYRRTENVARRLAARRDSIVVAARQVASESGMAAVQIAAVAARAGIAAGTVYRYFPSKTDLIAELVAAIAGRELSIMAAGRGAGAAVGAGGLHRHLRRTRAQRTPAGLGGNR